MVANTIRCHLRMKRETVHGFKQVFRPMFRGSHRKSTILIIIGMRHSSVQTAKKLKHTLCGSVLLISSSIKKLIRNKTIVKQNMMLIQLYGKYSRLTVINMYALCSMTVIPVFAQQRKSNTISEKYTTRQAGAVVGQARTARTVTLMYLMNLRAIGQKRYNQLQAVLTINAVQE